MNMKRAVMIFLFLITIPFLFALEEIEESVTFRIPEESLTVRSGETVPVAASVKIHSPWHINSSTPLDESFIPTSFSVDHEWVTLEGLDAPEHKLVTFAFSPDPLAVYEGDLTFQVRVKIHPEAKGTLIVPLTLTYQACNNQLCLPPTEITRTVTLTVSGASSASLDGGEEGTVADWIKGRGVFLTLLLIFLSGLALNLTPCVYPMIPITLGFFAAQAKERQGSAWPLALLYFLGITLTYSILGTVAAMTGGLFGNLLQNPIVLVIVAVVLVLLAFSMFDVYKLQLPSALTSRLSGRKGLIGAFLMGALVGLVAAPCIGPIVLGLLTYVAATGNPWTGFVMFFSLSAGLGLPYLILGVFSASLNRLPHSGTWMATIERIFGFLLLAAAVYLLRPLLPSGVDTLIFVILAAACALVLFFFMPTAGESTGWRIFRRILGVGFFAIAIFLALPLFHGDAKMEDDLWKPYTPEALQKAEEAGRPVVIDFYADWCLPCKELDHKTFSRPEVREELKKFVTLKADLTRTGSAEVKVLMKEFGIKGVPTIVIIDARGEERKDLTFVGFLEAHDFLSRLRAVPSKN